MSDHADVMGRLAAVAENTYRNASNSRERYDKAWDEVIARVLRELGAMGDEAVIEAAKRAYDAGVNLCPIAIEDHDRGMGYILEKQQHAGLRAASAILLANERAENEEVRQNHESLLTQAHGCYESVCDELRWSQEARAELLKRAEAAEQRVGEMSAILRELIDAFGDDAPIWDLALLLTRPAGGDGVS